MRIFAMVSSILLLSAVSLGQNGERGLPGYCPYACGPYVPLITTPSLSFQTVSPNPVGATNATGGLIAGATNSTLCEVSSNEDAVYTLPVWYSGGGTPLVSPAVNSPVGGMRMHAMHPENRERVQPGQHERGREAEAKSWVYFASAEPSEGSLEAASAAKGVHSAKRSYTNEDVQRQNDKNGAVHYDSKTEKIQ
jgi:hypothetical protein